MNKFIKKNIKAVRDTSNEHSTERLETVSDRKGNSSSANRNNNTTYSLADLDPNGAGGTPGIVQIKR